MFQFPPSPTVGQLFNPAPGINYRWNGTAWFPVGAASGGIKISDTEPVITTGEQWYESDTAGHYMRYQNPDGTSTLVSLAGAGGDFIPSAASTTIVPESRIINGGFAIDQRNAGNVVNMPGSDAYSVDRWLSTAIGTGRVSMQRQGTGTGKWVLTTKVVTPETPMEAGDLHKIEQDIEGNNLVGLEFNATALPFTFACDIRASVAGTYPFAFRNETGTASYVTTVTLAAGVWSSALFTVPGPTIGVWNVANGVGLRVSVCLGAGSSFTAPAANQWVAGNFMSAPGCTNLMATAGGELTLMNVRLYPGSIDYGPCRRLYAEELRLCQRYYQKSYMIDQVPGSTPTAGMRGAVSFAAGAGLTWVEVPLPVQMRAIPAITLYSNQTGATGVWRNDTADLAASTIFQSDNHFIVKNDAGTAANMGFSGHWTANAEL